MNRTKVILFGAALFFAALWGGSWAQSLLEGSWAEMPSNITAFLLGSAGFVVVAFGIIECKDLDKEPRP